MGAWSDWYSRNAGKENGLVNAEWVLGIIDKYATYSEVSGTTLGLVKLNGNYTFTGIINVPTPELPS
jgi:hypothetical protein